MFNNGSPLKGVNEDVINVSYYKPTEYVPQHIIHEILEYRGSTREPIWHLSVFIVARSGAKGHFPLILGSDMHKIVSAVHFKLGKYSWIGVA